MYTSCPQILFHLPWTTDIEKILEDANRRADSNQTVISGEYTDEVLTAKMLHADGWVSCSALRRHETDISSTLQL